MSKKNRKKKPKSNIVKYRKPFNIANLFFGAILVYMIIYIYMFLTSVHISGYEVIAGSLATNKQFTGLALRTEEVFYADAAGYVDYYANEGAKVSTASLVYTVDESGRMSEYLQENAQDIVLTDENYGILRSEVSAFGSNYDRGNFSSVYQFHNALNGSILELTNQTLLNEMESMSEEDAASFQRVHAAKSGIVEYYVDGMEQVTPETVTAEMFNRSSYEAKNLRSADLVSAGDPVYKLTTDENWSVIVPMTDDQIEEIAFHNVTDADGNISREQRTVLQVKFLRDDTTAWGYVSLFENGKQQYMQVDFNNSMVRFASERYIDLQFLVDDTSGLKIPSSAITTKEFFVIPETYIITGGKDNKEGFLVETFDEDGNAAQKFVTPTFYSKTDGMVYIDPKQGSFTSNETYIREGDRIIIPDSNERYQVGRTEELEGVYNINQGYTLFRKIKVLYSNEEYSIIEENTPFGLTIYDRIVLNGASVKEDQVIY